ncbi:MAG: GTP-binding protein, partial [Sneathiella sp.]
EILETQIHTAHLLLLNKCDLIDMSEIERLATKIRDINTAAPILNIINGVVAADIFFGMDMQMNSNEAADMHNHGHSHESDFSRWSFETHAPIDRSVLRGILEALPPTVLRFKGIFKGGDEAGLWIVHKVGPYIDFAALPTAREFSGKTGFVAIGLSNSNLAEIMDEAFGSLR